MICGIYKITNTINSKVYIGQSIDIHRRWKEERTNAFSARSNEYQTLKSKAFRKYGLENFLFEVIEECPPSMLNEREKYWINYYSSYTEGYNMTMGGDFSPHVNKLSSIEQVKCIIDDLKNTSLTGIELGKKYGVSDQAISDINCGHSWRIDGISYPIRSRKVKHYCPICGAEVSQKGSLCMKCYNKQKRIVERPDKDTLLEEIATSSFIKVGAKYGVSNTSIVKRCKAYGLPTKKRDLVNLYKQKKSTDNVTE